MRRLSDLQKKRDKTSDHLWRRALIAEEVDAKLHIQNSLAKSDAEGGFFLRDAHTQPYKNLMWAQAPRTSNPQHMEQEAQRLLDLQAEMELDVGRKKRAEALWLEGQSKRYLGAVQASTGPSSDALTLSLATYSPEQAEQKRAELVERFVAVGLKAYECEFVQDLEDHEAFILTSNWEDFVNSRLRSLGGGLSANILLQVCKNYVKSKLGELDGATLAQMGAPAPPPAPRAQRAPQPPQPPQNPASAQTPMPSLPHQQQFQSPQTPAPSARPPYIPYQSPAAPVVGQDDTDDEEFMSVQEGSDGGDDDDGGDDGLAYQDATQTDLQRRIARFNREYREFVEKEYHRRNAQGMIEDIQEYEMPPDFAQRIAEVCPNYTPGSLTKQNVAFTLVFCRAFLRPKNILRTQRRPDVSVVSDDEEGPFTTNKRSRIAPPKRDRTTTSRNKPKGAPVDPSTFAFDIGFNPRPSQPAPAPAPEPEPEPAMEPEMEQEESPDETFDRMVPQYARALKEAKRQEAFGLWMGKRLATMMRACWSPDDLHNERVYTILNHCIRALFREHARPVDPEEVYSANPDRWRMLQLLAFLNTFLVHNRIMDPVQWDQNDLAARRTEPPSRSKRAATREEHTEGEAIPKATKPLCDEILDNYRDLSQPYTRQTESQLKKAIRAFGRFDPEAVRAYYAPRLTLGQTKRDLILILLWCQRMIGPFSTRPLAMDVDDGGHPLFFDDEGFPETKKDAQPPRPPQPPQPPAPTKREPEPNPTDIEVPDEPVDEPVNPRRNEGEDILDNFQEVAGDILGMKNDQLKNELETYEYFDEDAVRQFYRPHPFKSGTFRGWNKKELQLALIFARKYLRHINVPQHVSEQTRAQTNRDAAAAQTRAQNQREATEQRAREARQRSNNVPPPRTDKAEDGDKGDADELHVKREKLDRSNRKQFAENVEREVDKHQPYTDELVRAELPELRATLRSYPFRPEDVVRLRELDEHSVPMNARDAQDLSVQFHAAILWTVYARMFIGPRQPGESRKANTLFEQYFPAFEHQSSSHMAQEGKPEASDNPMRAAKDKKEKASKDKKPVRQSDLHGKGLVGRGGLDQPLKYDVDLKNLRKNILSVRHKNNSNAYKVRPRHISGDCVKVIHALALSGRMDEPLFDRLPEAEKRLVEHYCRVSKIPGHQGMKHMSDLVERFEVCRGEMRSGNDSEQLKKEALALCGDLYYFGYVKKALFEQIRQQLR